jgi:hypothetical protein
MKKITANIFAILLFTFAGCSFTGCSTPALRIANSAAATQIDTVNAAMNAWGDYVRSGNATQAQVDRVHAMYDEYYKAVRIERDAMLAYQAVTSDSADAADLKTKWDNAKDSLSAIISGVIQMISDFQKGSQ